MDRDALVNEILELASACHTGGATDDERARLERLLEDSDEARTIYLHVADDTVTLNDVRQPRAAGAPAELATSIQERAPSKTTGTTARRGAWTLAAAAVLAAVGVALWHLRPASTPQGGGGSSLTA